MCRVISTFITQGDFWGRRRSSGCLDSPIGRERRELSWRIAERDGALGSSAAGYDVEHKQLPPQNKTKEKISPAWSKESNA